MITHFVLIAALAISNAAFAQGTPAGAPGASPSQPARVSGAITAIDSSTMTVKGQDGAETRVTFKPDLKVISVRPIEQSDIKAGTAALVVSKAEPNGTETVTAIRLSDADAVVDPPNSGPGAQPGTTMTNGKLTNVTRTDAGIELDVAYPGGTRHVLLPSASRVLNTYVVGQGALKVGVTVQSQRIQEPDGTVRTGAIMVMQGGPRGGGPPAGGPPR